MRETKVLAADGTAAVRAEAVPYDRRVLGVQLTEVELEILVALADGLQRKEIAQQLHRSVPTVESYIRVLSGKLNARTRTHLVAQAFRVGISGVAGLATPEPAATRPKVACG